jgi:hypothetical protein
MRIVSDISVKIGLFVKQGAFCMHSPQRVGGEVHGELGFSGLMKLIVASACTLSELI